MDTEIKNEIREALAEGGFLGHNVVNMLEKKYDVTRKQLKPYRMAFEFAASELSPRLQGAFHCQAVSDREAGQAYRRMYKKNTGKALTTWRGMNSPAAISASSYPEDHQAFHTFAEALDAADKLGAGATYKFHEDVS